MKVLQFVYLTRISEERYKHVWEDMECDSWDTTIGRMYLLKANESFEDKRYEDALAAFEQALSLFVKGGTYYTRALADKALVQCFLKQYDAALATIDQILTMSDGFDEYYRDDILNNRGAILVLKGAYSEALDALREQLERHPKDDELQFTLATCLLLMECYPEAVAAYEQASALSSYPINKEGLIAARQGRQPDWDSL